MNSILANQILDEFSSVFDDLSIKTFFSGFSLNRQETMFGWIGQSGFYLRGHQNYRKRFIELNMNPLVLSAGVSTKLLDYYQVGDDLMKDKPQLYAMAKMAIDHAHKDKLIKNRVKSLRIKELPNMTFSLERLLFSVGISDIDTFERVGYLEAFHRIKKKRSCVSINVLFLLYCALKRTHVGVLPDSTKKEIELCYQGYFQ